MQYHNKITGQLLVCIKLEVLELFVLLSLAIETFGIEETFLTEVIPIFFRQVSDLYLGFSLFPLILSRFS